jgi:hypothetical protein
VSLSARRSYELRVGEEAEGAAGEVVKVEEIVEALFGEALCVVDNEEAVGASEFASEERPRFSQPLQAVVLVDCQMRSMMSRGPSEPLGDEEVNSGRMAKLVEFCSAGFAGASRAVDDADIVGLPDFFESWPSMTLVTLV